MVTFGLHCILTLSLFSLVFSFFCVLVFLCSRSLVFSFFCFPFFCFLLLVLLCSRSFVFLFSGKGDLRRTRGVGMLLFHLEGQCSRSKTLRRRRHAFETTATLQRGQFVRRERVVQICDDGRQRRTSQCVDDNDGDGGGL